MADRYWRGVCLGFVPMKMMDLGREVEDLTVGPSSTEVRRRSKSEPRISQILAQRWLGRQYRKGRAYSKGSFSQSDRVKQDHPVGVGLKTSSLRSNSPDFNPEVFSGA